MGVYIPDMKLPSSCLMCDIPVRVQPCPVDHDNVSNYKTSRHHACPLIPVPPHGRLGDLDAAAELVMQYCPDDDGTCSKAGADLRDLLDEIENLPTIIPAEPYNKLSKPCKEDEA